jgi:hypothetical protein
MQRDNTARYAVFKELSVIVVGGSERRNMCIYLNDLL